MLHLTNRDETTIRQAQLSGHSALIVPPQFLVAVRVGLPVPFVCTRRTNLGKNSLVPICTRFISTTGSNPTKMPPPVGQRSIYKGRATSLSLGSVRLRTWTEFLRSTGVELIDQLGSTIRRQLHSEEWHFDISSSLYRADKSDGSFRCSC